PYDKRTKFLILASLSLFLIGSINPAIAGCSGVGTPGGDVCIENPLTGDSTQTEPAVLIGSIINAVMGVVGSLALAMFIYGGFMWMLSAGNDQRVQKGKDILTWATLGLIVIFSSYALVKLVFEGLGVT
ncbi:MAG: pilin, partial [Candidatus Magasanikbacteria bacterium]|nr:pilin [Candidatus Magasanikbacteria bacterium]